MPCDTRQRQFELTQRQCGVCVLIDNTDFGLHVIIAGTSDCQQKLILNMGSTNKQINTGNNKQLNVALIPECASE